MKEIGIICLVLAAFLGGGGLWAHHSPSAEFDMSKSFSVSGTLTKVDWINPHIMMLLDVNGEEWKFESNPPAWFRRVGIARADFADAIGQKSAWMECEPATARSSATCCERSLPAAAPSNWFGKKASKERGAI